MSDITETQETKSSQKTVTERVPGTTILPLARIKRVIKEDKDVSLINAEATFCIAYATELFMEYLVTEAFTKAKKEKRKTVYYRDLAGTVKEIEQFEFLEDVIPTTMTLKAAIEKRKETLHEEETPAVSPSKKQKTTEEEEEEEEEEEVIETQDDDEDMEEITKAD
ncbi:histone-fold-containing protein [Mucor mucedo]|uniref:Transcription factor CBF/NF-Y/archaeal histone domain-containing protein n=1 Tax=Mucor saturninus TaxID=64648 RepID=A0A8H7RHN5_9FUNG|nr:histone-fold-containing protein [Mucor mucedo]KAG2211649.1 hypothetical protein INT47_008746 [Mucor saturninus]KAI7889603.1 histone-fold-containing protein [Mucor mucedo]